MTMKLNVFYKESKEVANFGEKKVKLQKKKVKSALVSPGGRN